ncbi:MAG: 50S ribosomal protein L9 [Alphaproteobacteria bacterium]|nr:50S ribosomal protein L9 [Alphaproteobacteria bacterium]
MDIILLERIRNLGEMGELVRVKTGYARNFLLPKGKALRASKESKARFEVMRAELEEKSLQRKDKALEIAKTLEGQQFVVIRSASENDQLYGSVSPTDVVSLLKAASFSISRDQVQLDMRIKTLGLHQVIIQLHPEIETLIWINIARSEEEALLQKLRGAESAIHGPLEEPVLNEDEALAVLHDEEMPKETNDQDAHTPSESNEFDTVEGSESSQGDIEEEKSTP